MLLLLSPNERCAKSNDKAPKERSTAGTSDVKIPEPDKPLPAFLRFLSPDFPFLANMLLIVKRSDVFFYLRVPIEDKEMSLGAACFALMFRRRNQKSFVTVDAWLNGHYFGSQ
jgi:hypothetical protein